MNYAKWKKSDTKGYCMIHSHLSLSIKTAIHTYKYIINTYIKYKLCISAYIFTYKHLHIYIYISLCVCVYMRVWTFGKDKTISTEKKSVGDRFQGFGVCEGLTTKGQYGEMCFGWENSSVSWLWYLLEHFMHSLKLIDFYNKKSEFIVYKLRHKDIKIQTKNRGVSWR